MLKDLPESYKQILSLIGYGKENAKTVAYISKLVGLPSTTVRAMVSELVVRYGLGIGTSNTYGCSGYYFVTNDEEKTETVRNFRSRATKILKKADVIASLPPGGQGHIYFD